MMGIVMEAIKRIEADKTRAKESDPDKWTIETTEDGTVTGVYGDIVALDFAGGRVTGAVGLDDFERLMVGPVMVDEITTVYHVRKHTLERSKWTDLFGRSPVIGDMVKLRADIFSAEDDGTDYGALYSPLNRLMRYWICTNEGFDGDEPTWFSLHRAGSWPEDESVGALAIYEYAILEPNQVAIAYPNTAMSPEMREDILSSL